MIADALNHSFVTSVQTNFTPTGPSETADTNIKKYLLPRQANSIFLSPTTPEEILTLINGLDSTKSCGHQWRLVVKMAGRAAKFHLWLNIQDCRPAPGCL